MAGEDGTGANEVGGGPRNLDLDRGGEEQAETKSGLAVEAGDQASSRADYTIRRERPRPGSELASYWVSGGERLLICAEGLRGLEILDVAADFLGPSYRVDTAFEDESALWAVVEDYLGQARKLNAPPMSGEALATLMLSRSD